MSSDFEFAVTLSPENEKHWQEMVQDAQSRTTILNFYRHIVQTTQEHTEQSFETLYLSYKEGRLDEQYQIFMAMQERNFVETIKNM